MRLSIHDGFGDIFLPTEAHLLKWLATALAAALVASIALSQTSWARHLSLFPCYALPIGLATAMFGRRVGLVWAYACLGACLWVGLRPDRVYPHLWIPYFNALARLPFFLMVVCIVGQWMRGRHSGVAPAQAVMGLSVCTCCDRVRQRDGAWSTDESLQRLRGAPGVTHRMCTDCARRNYALAARHAEGY